jgi:hypothetical protein
MKHEQGFSLMEMMVATSLTIVIGAAIVAAVHPAEGMFLVETEAADMQQRIRVAATMLTRDLAEAGAGSDAGDGAGPLSDAVASVLPYRQASNAGDPAGAFRSDVLTLMSLPSRAQATLADAMPGRSGAVRVNIGPGCPLIDAACGLSVARTALVYDFNGRFDRFRVESVDGSLVALHHTLEDSAIVHPPGSRIAEAAVRSYFLRTDAMSGVSQLVRDDGDGRSPAPVLDHVVALGFRYFGDVRPPTPPKPPPIAEQPTAYPPGENCLVVRDALGDPAPRLGMLAPDAGGLVELTARLLTDGPWCPDDLAPNRFDADLLRMRKVAVTIAVESAADRLRGPAGGFFARAGTATSASRWLPDRTVRFEVSLRNLGSGFAR